MERTTARQLFEANVDQAVEVHWTDGFVQLVRVLTVDGEGFVHKSASHNAEGPFWSSFDDISEVVAPKNREIIPFADVSIE